MGAALLMLLAFVPFLGGLTMDEDAGFDGSDASEKIEGGVGTDRIAANGGNDILVGGAGDDLLDGGEGNDWLLGQTGDDTLEGGPDTDVIVAGDGADVIDAGDGGDFVEAAEIVDSDRLNASLAGLTSSRDIDFAYDYSGPDGADAVDLGDGDDTVIAGDGDTLTGGAGADEFVMGDWVQGTAPIEVTDYDPTEDILTFSYALDTPLPDLSLSYDPDSGDAMIRAGETPIAVIRGAGPDFGLNQIALATYRR